MQIRNIFIFKFAGLFFSTLLVFSLFLERSEAHFGFFPQVSLFPKSLPEPDRELLRYRNKSYSRFDFVNFLRLSQDIKASVDTNQRISFGFAVIFDFINSRLSGNLLALIPDIENGKATLPKSKKFIKKWASKQPEIFLAIQHLARTARSEQLHENANLKRRLKYFETAALALYLEDFIKLSDFEPTLAGLRSYVSDYSSNKRSSLDKKLKKTQSVDLLLSNNRWKNFRSDILKHYSHDRFTGSISEVPKNPKTVLGQFERNKILWEQFIAIHGEVDTNVYWNAIKSSRIGQMILNSILALEVKRQGIIPYDVAKRIELAQDLFLAMEFISRRVLKSSAISLPELYSLTSPDSADLLLATFREETLSVFEKSKYDKKFFQTVEWIIISPITKELPDYLS